MNGLALGLVVAALALGSISADAQVTVRVRGAITAIDGNVLSVKSREGKDLRIELTDKLSVGTFKALALSDIKPGAGIGTSAMKRADGTLVALEVRVFPADRSVPNPGHRPWDLQPGSTMTNATVSAMVEATDGRDLTLSYEGGSQKLFVPAGVPIVMPVAGDRALLRVGEYVLIMADVDAAGRMTASRVQVSSSGVKPPQ